MIIEVCPIGQTFLLVVFVPVSTKKGIVQVGLAIKGVHQVLPNCLNLVTIKADIAVVWSVATCYF